MRLDTRARNRALLERQQLLCRSTDDPVAMVGRLLGLQAQSTLPPYLGLAARLEDFDPLAASAALADGRLVRSLTMRGTVHLLTVADALELRPFVDAVLARGRRQSPQTVGAREVAPADLVAAADTVLADGPLPVAELGLRLQQHFPDAPATGLAQLARLDVPMAQLPPRGQWKGSGGVVYQRLDTLTGQPLRTPDVPGIVRRYLAAFGPASAADVTAWSGVTRLGPVLKTMTDLEQHTDERGKVLYDLPGATLPDPDVPAPVRLLGGYDNLWLSHAARDLVMTPETRSRWMTVNGANDHTVFVDGWFTGQFKVVDERPRMVELFRTLTRAEQIELDEELDRLGDLLAR